VRPPDAGRHHHVHREHQRARGLRRHDDGLNDDSGEVAALGIDVVVPALVDPDGGSRLVVRGTGFEPGMIARIGGIEVAAIEWIDAGELRVTSPALAGRGAELDSS
jgi:hypothetical protein